VDFVGGRRNLVCQRGAFVLTAVMAIPYSRHITRDPADDETLLADKTLILILVSGVLPVM